MVRGTGDSGSHADGNERAKQEFAEGKIAKFFLQNSIPFGATKTLSFQEMVDAIGECGRGFRAPTSERLQSSLLDGVRSDVQAYYNLLKSEWAEKGCTILCNRWMSRLPLLAFSVASSSGTYFLNFANVSDHEEDPRYLFRLIEEVVLEVGVERVVQVITDRTDCYEHAGRLLVDKYPSLFWSPCASQSIEGILEDYSKIDWVKTVLEEASMITAFIYGNDWVLNFMRLQFTGGSDLVRPNLPEFASKFLCLSSIVEQEMNLKRMTTHIDWLSISSHARESEAKSFRSILHLNRFWKSAREAVSVTKPLIKVLRLVDGDMPAMGYIYEAMENAKLSIKGYYQNAGEKFECIREIIDRRWSTQQLPLSASAAFLNPSIFFRPRLSEDTAMSSGFKEAKFKMAREDKLRSDITMQQSVYTNAQGALGKESAIRDRTLYSPGHWWAKYGHEIPELQKMAIRILGQPCSSYWRGWNWKTNLEKMHSRGLLRGCQPDDALVLLHCNLWLQAVAKSKRGAESRRAVNVEEVDFRSEWPSETEVSLPLLDVAVLES